jgi:RNA polymerase sigma factor (sigma-70 family)
MNPIIALSDVQRNLVAEHTDIVKWAIYRYIKVNQNACGLSYDDLFQEGCLCLCHAAATYDGERAQFVTFAQVVVRNRLYDYCKKISGKNKNSISLEDKMTDEDGNLTDPRGFSIDPYETLVADTAVFNLMESVKAEYDGVTRLGIEALELKAKGYTGADIALLWGVEQNHVGAWISRAKKKLRENERFVKELRSA